MRELAVLVNAASNKLKKQKQDKEEKLREKAAAVPAADEQQLSWVSAAACSEAARTVWDNLEEQCERQ